MSKNQEEAFLSRYPQINEPNWHAKMSYRNCNTIKKCHKLENTWKLHTISKRALSRPELIGMEFQHSSITANIPLLAAFK